MSESYNPNTAGFCAVMKHTYLCTAGGWRTRATRREYWLAVLGLLPINILLMVMGNEICNVLPDCMGHESRENVLILWSFLWFFFGFLPVLCLFMRRMHDLGSGGWLFLLLYLVLNALSYGWFVCELTVFAIPFLGIFDSQRGSNKWGPSSKYPDSAAEAPEQPN